MPNWKKVLVSGSDASLNSLSVDTSITASQLLISSSGDENLRIIGSGSTIMEIEGSQGILFSVTDNLIGSISSINDINGLSIFEVFSDDTVEMGTFNNRGLIVSGSQVVGNTQFSGSIELTGSLSLSSGNLNLSSVSNAGTDTDKFVVLDGGQLKYRSGVELRSDIDLGATDTPTFAGAAFSGLTNANTDTDKFLVLNSSNIVKFRTGTELYDDIGITSLSSSIAADITSIQSSVDSVVTPIQLTFDCKALSSGHLPWSALSDLQPNPNRAYTTWIAPTNGYLEKVIISPEQANGTPDTMRISLINGGSVQSGTQSQTLGAAGSNVTFTFGSTNYSFSSGDRLGLEIDKVGNTADLYNIMVIFRLDN